MRYIIMLIMAVLLGSFTRPAQADHYNFRHGFEYQVGGSLGGSVIETFDSSDESTSKTYALNLVGRIRHHRTPFVFEQTIIIPHGMMSALLLDVWRAERWRLHLDLGMFRPIAGQHLSATNINRSWDLVLGFGGEVLAYKRLAITVDWRMFFPDPTSVPQMYGDFVRPIYKDAQRGGQLWLGANWVF